MNTFWSDYVQSPEELYQSRSLRFREDNREEWLRVLGVREGMETLEIGCGPGLLCHRLKSWLPSLMVTGVDRDSRHLAFARQKAAEQGLDCTFWEGDATSLPFENNRFGLCFSHTVMEHVEPRVFLREQYRVLRPGGRIVILSVRPNLSLNTEGWRPSGEEEESLCRKAWTAAENFQKTLPPVCAYPISEEAFGPLLTECGFQAVNLRFLIDTHVPDNADTPPKRAMEAFEEERFSALSSLEKALRMAPGGLTLAEENRLRELINRRFDSRIAAYRRGEKRWEVSYRVTLAVTGEKGEDRS